MKSNLFVKALFFSLSGVLLYVIYLSFPHKEFIRKWVEDKAFDFINYTFLENKKVNIGLPIVVFLVDNQYLKTNYFIENGLLTKEYGNVLPRGNIATFIKDLNDNSYLKPKALIIDYDLDFNRYAPDNNLTQGEKELIETLQNIDYDVYIPKGKVNSNFLEDNITNKHVKFGSIIFEKNDDEIVRRYITYQKIKDKKYYFIPYLIFKNTFFQGYDFNQMQQNNLINYKIVLKNMQKENNRLYWDNVYIYSATEVYDKHLDVQNPIIILGADNNFSNDKSLIKKMFDDYYIANVIILANAIKTIEYFKGYLKKISNKYAIALTFFIFFISYILAYVLARYLKVLIKINLFVFILFSITLLFMFISSYILLSIYLVWYNFFIPFIIYNIYNLYKLINHIILMIKITKWRM